jgi:hypothetical protein
MRPVPPWLGEIVKARIERLRLLGLDGQPLGRSMGEVTVIWAEVLTRRLGAPDPALDGPRVHAAFDELERRAERWPAPAQLLAALPGRRLPTALPAPRAAPGPGRARVQALIQQILTRGDAAAPARDPARHEKETR